MDLSLFVNTILIVLAIAIVLLINYWIISAAVFRGMKRHTEWAEKTSVPK